MSPITPCVKICQLNAEKTACTGCDRTLAEIRDWSEMSDTQRQQVMQDLKTRQSQAPQVNSMQRNQDKTSFVRVAPGTLWVG